jgi:hypothetical protein
MLTDLLTDFCAVLAKVDGKRWHDGGVLKDFFLGPGHIQKHFW